MSEQLRESPLGHREKAANLSIGLREITGHGMIDLRGDAKDRKFMAAVKAALGFDIPKSPRTSVAWGDMKALWLSIDQWLVVCPLERTVELLASLRKNLGGIHSLAVDVSDMRAIMRLEGERAREVLLKGTSLDLLSDDYKPGACRRMRYAEIAALLDVVEDNVFDVYVFRSYADYAWDFVCATARKGSEVALYAKTPPRI
jgi:sarcosine oxidase subunit gamma